MRIVQLVHGPKGLDPTLDQRLIAQFHRIKRLLPGSRSYRLFVRIDDLVHLIHTKNPGIINKITQFTDLSALEALVQKLVSECGDEPLAEFIFHPDVCMPKPWNVAGYLNRDGSRRFEIET